MRLLKSTSHARVELTPDLIDAVPAYAILSHTWGDADQEVTFDDLVRGRGTGKQGYRKIQFCREKALRDGLQHLWIDTCCIDRANHVELSEAITSMFRWYREAARCYVYLADVSDDGHDSELVRYRWEDAFRKSRWWRRGWTLQELLAPASVEFFSREGMRLGSKKTLEALIHEITQIPIAALRGEPLSGFTVDERLRWTNGRQTKKMEDKAYCLLGILDVSMSLRYGEGEKALARLEAKVKGSSRVKSANVSFSDEEASKLDTNQDELIHWLAPARSEELHTKTAASRHPDTGVSFTSGPLLQWLTQKRDQASLMWINGKSGTGKTTLFSHIVDKTRSFSLSVPSTAVAYHYCAFSDPASQQLTNILGSLVAQISAQQPAILDDIRRVFQRDQTRKQDRTLQATDLEKVLVKHIPSFRNAILLLDALNESSDFTENLACIVRLLQQLPNLMVLVTSTRSASTAGISQWPHAIDIQLEPDEDIQAYIEAHLSDAGSLGHLSHECRQTIRSTLMNKADQTFRWVALLLDNLCKQRTGKAVLKALEQMPSTLNSTYASMLRVIPEIDRPIAREALLWLSFSLRPMTLLELSEAAVLEDSDPTLDQDSRLRHPEEILDICNGFVEHDVDSNAVKLAHSSVKDYLLSDYARTEGDKFFSFAINEGNQALMRRCLTYLMFDDFRPGVASTRTEFLSREQDFPLLDYAAHYWGLHASSASTVEWHWVQKFFSTRTLLRGGNYGAWVSYLIPDCHPTTAMSTQPLYYAASFGIVPIVRALLRQPRSIYVDLEHPGGRHGSTALQAACFRGKKQAAEYLVAAGADFWSKDRGSGAPAWFWAQCNDWTDMVNDMIRRRPEIARKTELQAQEISRAKHVQASFGVSFED
ncbi:uncharacterized protein HMPREF1541_03236 [Cyphellophora europaea CBS 101466]|uniref:Uncharacterized protein n=1 Tax=Cyphellophora europaea (strain CBS 101466) TaxID=1220924 RepID=W2RXQ7_CYPE1|nr:uncharacterized protein HMPREF1541_03236 [Cyphellophora europaea CBS 101466]ETN41301.1 hypothetical protein HMPREF1541_03236 [Cyphellophora europaea CBS 101466]